MAPAVTLDRLAGSARVAKRHRMKPMKWITDRPPTVDDANANGEVVIRNPSDGRLLARHWTEVLESHMWHPITTKRRIVSLARTVLQDGHHTIDVVADDGTAWWMVPGEAGWTQLPSLPDREVG